MTFKCNIISQKILRATLTAIAIITVDVMMTILLFNQNIVNSDLNVGRYVKPFGALTSAEYQPFINLLIVTYRLRWLHVHCTLYMYLYKIAAWT